MKWIKNLLRQKAGKLALTGLQALGLSAAVGVAGIAAWQMLSSSDDVNADTVFSAANDSEVVYVAGTSGANAYTGVSGYGDGGAVQSGINMRMSKDMKMMESDLINAKIAEQKTEMDTKEDSVKSFKMDGTSTGLGMDSAATDPQKMMSGLQGGGMPDIQSQIAALQQQAEAAQKKAAAEAGANAEAAGMPKTQEEMKEALAKLNAVSNMNSGGGANGTMTNPGLLRSNVKENQNNLTASSVDGTEGTAGKLNNKKNSLGKDKNVKFLSGKDFQIEKDSLEAAVTIANLTAKNQARSSVDIVDYYMANEELAGGTAFTVGDKIVYRQNTGQNPGDNGDSQVSGLAETIDLAAEEAQQFEDARKELRNKMYIFLAAAAVLVVTAWFISIPWLAWVWFGALAGLIVGYGFLMKATHDFQKKWTEEAKYGNYLEKNKFHAKVYATASVGMGAALISAFASILGGTIALAAVIPMLFINFGSKDYKAEEEPTTQQEVVVPTSPYGDNVAEDALYLHNDMGSPKK